MLTLPRLAQSSMQLESNSDDPQPTCTSYITYCWY